MGCNHGKASASAQKLDGSKRTDVMNESPQLTLLEATPAPQEHVGNVKPQGTVETNSGDAAEAELPPSEEPLEEISRPELLRRPHLSQIERDQQQQEMQESDAKPELLKQTHSLQIDHEQQQQESGKSCAHQQQQLESSPKADMPKLVEAFAPQQPPEQVPEAMDAPQEDANGKLVEVEKATESTPLCDTCDMLLGRDPKDNKIPTLPRGPSQDLTKLPSSQDLLGTMIAARKQRHSGCC